MAWIASWQPRPGRNPWDLDSNRASHSGSSAFVARASRHLSAITGIPRPRRRPSGFGTYTRLTGLGFHAAARCCIQSANSALPWGSSTTFPSMPAVLRPAFCSVTRRTLSSVLARERSINLCRLRTLFRSPACDAAKILCLSRRTSSSTARQSIAAQSVTASSGPFATPTADATVCAAPPVCAAVASNLSLGSGVVVHRVLAGSPDPRQRPFRPGSCPYPVSYAGAAGGDPGSRPRFPAACSATGVRFLDHPAPAGGMGLPHGRLTGRTGRLDPIGVVVLHMSKTRPGRAPPLLRGRRCAPSRQLRPGWRLPLPSGQSLRPRWNIPPAGVTFTKPHQGFTCVRPSPRPAWMAARDRVHPIQSGVPAGLLLACDPRVEQGPLGFFPGLRTPQSPATHAEAETGHTHWPGYYTLDISRAPSVPPTSLKHPHIARSCWWPPSPPAERSGCAASRPAPAAPAPAWRTCGPPDGAALGCPRGDPNTRRHTGLADVERTDPLHQLHRLLGLLHLILLARRQRARLPGEPAGTVKNRALVLKATMQGPKAAPSVRLIDGLDQRQGVATSAGSQPDFQPSTGVPAGDIEDSLTGDRRIAHSRDALS